MNKYIFEKIFAALFAVIGIAWLLTIYFRCDYVLSKDRVTAVDQVVSSSKKLAPLIQEMSQTLERVEANPYTNLKKERSSHVKPLHIILFWIIACLEIICGLLYVASSAALWMSSSSSSKISLLTLVLDVVFKSAALLYMQFIAIPLSHMTWNHKNILTSYYVLEEKFVSKVGLWLTGLEMFKSDVYYVYIIICLIYFICSFYFFIKLKTKKVLSN